MKVLIVHSAYQQAGGEDAVVKAEQAMLARQGIDVEVVKFSNTKHALAKYLLLPFNPASYLKLKKTIRRFKPDIIHIHNLHFAASYSVIYASKRMGVPVVMTLHNFRLFCPTGTLFHNGKMYYKSINANFPWDAVKQKVYNRSYLLTFWLAMNIWLAKRTRLWNKVDKFITLNTASKKIFEDARLSTRADQFTVKQNFVPVKNSLPDVKRSHEFLFVGRLTEEKGVKVLVQAINKTNHKLRIIGDGPLKSYVQDAVNVNPNITYAGFKDNDSVRLEMQTCTAIIFPSIWLEGMPITIIEAFAAGVPVIASEIGAMKSMIRHNYNGLLFKPGNVQELTNKLNDWSSLSKEEQKSFYQNAYSTYLDQYTSEKNYKMLLDIYQSVKKS